VAQDLAKLARIRDERDELHRRSATRTDQGIDLVDFRNQSRPRGAGGALGDGMCRGVSVGDGRRSSMRVSPANRGDTGDVRQTLPARLASGRVQAVVMDRANVPGGATAVCFAAGCRPGDELRKSGDEVRGVPERGVVLEVGIVLMLTLHLLCRSGAKESDLVVQHLDA
jgi:hypothetical protein